MAKKKSSPPTTTEEADDRLFRSIIEKVAGQALPKPKTTRRPGKKKRNQ